MQVTSSAKKLKTNVPGRPQGLPSTSLLPNERIGAQPSAEPWESLVTECEPQDLFDNIMNNAHAGNVDKAVRELVRTIDLTFRVGFLYFRSNTRLTRTKVQTV